MNITNASIMNISFKTSKCDCLSWIVKHVAVIMNHKKSNIACCCSNESWSMDERKGWRKLQCKRSTLIRLGK